MKFLEKKQPIQVSQRGNLPHWEQGECVQFITFRLADSLPLSKIQETIEIKNRFIETHPLPWDEKTAQEYKNAIAANMDTWLDKGYGSSLLRNAEARTIITKALKFLNGKDFELYAYVIMPNHVHLLLSPYISTPEILHKLKSFTAQLINKRYSRKGAFWQKGYFDRLVRSAFDFENYIDYILENPKNLQDTDYSIGGESIV